DIHENKNLSQDDQTAGEIRKPDFSRFIALDLETTGLDPVEGEIVEIGAILFEGEQETDSYHAMVKPSQGFPERNRRLTGIDPKLLDNGMNPPDAFKGLVEFVGNELLVSHNVKFDIGFLAHHFKKHDMIPLANPALCTLHLAAIVNPEEDTLQLGALAESWGIVVKDPHRALQDARTAGRIFIKISNEIRSWPKKFVSHLASYRGKSIDPIFDLLDSIAGNDPSGDELNLGEEILACFTCMRSAGTLPAVLPLKEQLADQGFRDPMLSREVADAFQKGGLTLLEDRRSDAPCVSGVFIPDAFNGMKLTVGVESEEMRRRVIGFDGGTDGWCEPGGSLYLGCRSEYVCLRKAIGDDNRPAGWKELSPYERIVLARWLAGTLTGRHGRINWWLINNFSGFKGHLNSIAANPLNCEASEAECNTDCFIKRAIERGGLASKVAVNDSHLFYDRSEGEKSERLLGEMKALIIEDGSRLEEHARNAKKNVIELDSLLKRVTDLYEKIAGSDYEWAGHVKSGADAIRELLECSRRTMRDLRENVRREGQGPIAVDEEIWASVEFDELAGAIDQCIESLKRSEANLAKVGDLPPDYRALANGFSRGSSFLRDFRNARSGWAASIEGAPFRNPKRVTYRLEPVNTEEYVRKLIDSVDGPVIIAGRHLRSRGSFSTLREKWGFGNDRAVSERVIEDDISVPIPLYLPDDITPPTSRAGRKYHWLKYMERTANLLTMLSESLGGRTVAVFSAHHELRKVREILESSPPKGAVVLAQYNDGTRGAIIREYMQNPATLLLGGRNFLDGVDLRPAGFTALVIVKLPFVSPEEPLHRAALKLAGGQGMDGLQSYLVPLASDIMNRWIDCLTAGPLPEGASDEKPSGAVILLDPRAATNEWGDDLLAQLDSQDIRRISFREMLSDFKSIIGG
ncbi:MAG: exonuclease domain-containing protein, partial [bacterium]